MKIGIDYWQVISHYPEKMGILADSLYLHGHDVHVISAVGKNRVGTVADEVIKAWGDFRREKIHEVVFEHPRESPELKLAKCQELGITMFFDDREDVCRLLSENGVLAFRVPRKDNSTYDLGGDIANERVMSRAEIRAKTKKGGPCETCGEPRNIHVCISCSPTGETPGPGCINCRNTGWDQTPCLPSYDRIWANGRWLYRRNKMLIRRNDVPETILNQLEKED